MPTDAINQLLYLTLVKPNALTRSMGTRPPTLYTETASGMWADLAVQILEEDGWDTCHGHMLARHVMRFQTIHNLTPDGIIGPHTWAALGVCDWDDPSEMVFMRARWDAYLPVRETEGNNRGKMIRDLFHDKDGQPWCLRWATHCWVAEGVPRALKHRSSSSVLLNAAIGKGRAFAHRECSFLLSPHKIKPRTVTIPAGEFTKPCIGLLRGGSTGVRHAFYVWMVEGGWAYTIEGNVSNGQWYRGIAPGRDLVKSLRRRLDKIVMAEM